MKSGFALGFAVVAILFGAYAWREGWLPGQHGARTTPAIDQNVTVAPKSDKAGPGPQADKGAAKPDAGVGAGGAPQAGAQTPFGATPGAPAAGATPPAPSAQGEAPKPEGQAAAGATPPAAAGAPLAGATPSGAAAAAKPSVDPNKGAFDIVRVEPTGESVVAGRCSANCTVELTANGKTIDKATADAGGNFALTPPTLPAGDHQLGLKVTGADGSVSTSEQTVTVSVPKAPARDVVVVLNDPDAPSKILQQPGQAPAAAKPAETAAAAGAAGAESPATKLSALSLGAIDADNGRFFVQGLAPAGSKLKVYLNNSLIAEPVAGADDRWSVRVERGLTAGKYVARVDHVDPKTGKVVTRAEAGFDYEGEVAAAPNAGSAAGSAQPSAPGAGAATAAPGQQAAAGSPAAPTGAGSAASPSPSAAAPAGSSANAPAAGSQAPAASAALGMASKPDGQGQPPAASAAAPSAGASGEAGATANAGSAAPAASAATAGQKGDDANPVVASIDTAKVKRGDSLWRISRATYGHGRRYTIIFTANDSQIRNPDLIYPGQVLVLPSERSDAANR